MATHWPSIFGQASIDLDEFLNSAQIKGPGEQSWYDVMQNVNARRVVPAQDHGAGFPAQLPGTFDVLLIGGGLSSLLALGLAERGHRVAVLEAGKFGTARREWNVSREEMSQLAELLGNSVQDWITHQYKSGTVQWHGHDVLTTENVLDCVVSPSRLFAECRQRLEAAGAIIVEGVLVQEPQNGRVTCHSANGKTKELSARLILDGRGHFEGEYQVVCPTVGGVFEGLTHDPSIGDILSSVDDVFLVDGNPVQMIWEAFPGPGGHLTVYAFYYTSPGRAVVPLDGLYHYFLANLSKYKPGVPKLIKPTFGVITGSTNTSARIVSPVPGVLHVGDRAAQHSALTFCGFGRMVRSVPSIVKSLDGLLRQHQGPIPSKYLEECRAGTLNTSMIGYLGLMMGTHNSHARKNPQAINQLLDDAFRSLWEMGPETVQRFLKDQFTPEELIDFMWRTFQKYPSMSSLVIKSMSAREMTDFAQQLIRARFSS